MKLLISLFGWVPVLGNALKMAYISQRVKEAISNVQVSNDKANEQAEESAKYFEQLAEETYDEHIQPQINELDIPDIVSGKLKEKSIRTISNALKDKYLKKTNG